MQRYKQIRFPEKEFCAGTIARLCWHSRSQTRERFILSPKKFCASYASAWPRLSICPENWWRTLVGNPFRLAVVIEDPDAEYPITLKLGVPLGVTDSAFKFPDIWPRSRTFENKKDFDMVSRPHNTIHEVACLCGCQQSELCSGPMAAIDEGDKVRAIHDRGANARIQNHTFKRCSNCSGLCPRHSMNQIPPGGGIWPWW